MLRHEPARADNIQARAEGNAGRKGPAGETRARKFMMTSAATDEIAVQEHAARAVGVAEEEDLAVKHIKKRSRSRAQKMT